MSLYPDLQPGEIITISVQLTYNAKVKIRPALVISQNTLHQNSQGFLFLAITSNRPRSYMKPISFQDIECGKLERPSSVIYDKIVWTEQDEINKRIGKVKKEFLTKVVDLVKQNVLSKN